MKVVIQHHDGELIELISAKAYEAEPGVITVLGELMSRSGHALRNVRVLATVQDGLADPVGYGEVELGDLAPGQRLPVSLRLQLLGADGLDIFCYVACDIWPESFPSGSRRPGKGGARRKKNPKAV